MGIIATVFDDFEKLINEHGSAAILRERIALAEDKYTAMEKRAVESETKAQNLEVKVQSLEFENQGLKINNKELQEKIGNFEKQLNHGDSLHEFEIKTDIFDKLGGEIVKFMDQLLSLPGLPIKSP